MTPRRGRRWFKPSAVLLVVAVGLLCAREGRTAGLGMSNATAIEVCGQNGAHAYLDRLMCSDGTLVKYEIRGNEGLRNNPASKADQEAARIQMLTSAPISTGQRDFHRIDAFTVECSAGQSILYVDSSHCPDPKNQGPPPGFSFLDGQAQGSPTTDSRERGLGLAKETAIEVCGPKGASDYLSRLRCPDNSAVRAQRTGNMGFRNDPTPDVEDAAARQQWMTTTPIPVGQRDFHLVDAYSADCAGQKKSLYLDPYHCPDPRNQSPPPGYTLASGKKAS